MNNDLNNKMNDNFVDIYNFINKSLDISLSDDIEEYKIENNDYNINNLPDKMYFGSKNKLTQLEGGKLFLSPYIGISSIFIIDRNNIIREMMKEQLGEYPKHYTGNISYKEWDTMTNDQLKEPLKFVHMTHNYVDLKGKKSGESKGYIYEIDISNIKDKLKLFVSNNANREVIYTGKEPLIPDRIIPHTIKWSMEFDEDNYNKHGKGIFEKMIEDELSWITEFANSDYFRENIIFNRIKGEKLIRELNREDVNNPYFVRWFFKEKDFQDMEPEQFNFDILIHDGNTNFSYGCFIDNKLEGIICTIKHDGYFEINMFYVDMDVFNNGVGQYLLEYTLNKFKNKKLRLKVFEWNKKARYIYEKYGFKIISEYINKSKDDNQYIGDKVYVMERKIDNIVPFSKEYYIDYFKQWLCKTDEFRDDNPATLDKYINKFLYTNDNPSYVYLKDNKPEGFISIHGDDPIAISMLFVNPKIQGSGIGNKLLKFVIDSFKNRNFILKVFTDNIHAINLYKKHGFFISNTVTITKELAGGYDEYIGKQMYTMERVPNNSFNEAVIVDKPDDEPIPEDHTKNEENKEEKPKSDKNGVNRKKLYIAFIEYAKSINQKNAFGSLFDKDIFHQTYPFVPNELRFFYRISNPVLCVLKDNLTFFQVSELKKINEKNSEINEKFIFAGTMKELIFFNTKDKKVYKGTEEGDKIKVIQTLANTFDLYIQNMIGKGDILNSIE